MELYGDQRILSFLSENSFFLLDGRSQSDHRVVLEIQQNQKVLAKNLLPIFHLQLAGRDEYSGATAHPSLATRMARVKTGTNEKEMKK